MVAAARMPILPGMSLHCRAPACRRSYLPVRGRRGAARLGTRAYPRARPASPGAPKPNTVSRAIPNAAMHGVSHGLGSAAGFRGSRAALGQTAVLNLLAIAAQAWFRESNRSIIGRNAGRPAGTMTVRVISLKLPPV